MAKIKAAIVGVGNCASALVQGVYYYKNATEDEFVPGVTRVKLGGYHIGDIEWVAAFDVSKNKIGKDLAQAIFEPPNVTPRFADIPERLGVYVSPGPVLDGVAPHMKERFNPIEKEVSLGEVVDVLKESGAEILINFLPVGSEKATRFYAEAALEAGVAFINGMPVFIASDQSEGWPKKFEEKGIPVTGDDIKGQLGATVFHRTLVRLMHMRGVKVEETYQLNIGGNTDFENMLVEERLKSKRISKTQAVTSILPYGNELYKNGKVRIGPSDFVPFLGNTKVAYIYLKGTSFGGFPVTIEAKLTVDDKSMFAGAMIDAIRGTKVAIDRGIGGPLVSVSAPFFKHPPVQAPSDEIALQWFEEFIEGKRER
ncbi:MAG: inositol-3-phosphate synthase [Desulfurococcales archaeon]|nr:inositol-3-phosphate synthase [Desulfurococcales archaeon]